MTTSTCSATKPTHHCATSQGVTEFRFDDDGSLVPLGGSRAFDEERSDRSADVDAEIDLRDTDQIEHLVHLVSGDVATVLGANAYQPEGPMTTFFSTGSSRGTIDSWSVRVASYRTNDIVSIQRSLPDPSGLSHQRPNLVAV